ncbi:peptide chain release factor H [Cardiobacterium hominis]|uniref:peptide chain release factor H n=1 Tax=Cardiobacterium hominis TaxID=2718 RepID=UPI0028F1425D|nr:peptide chain release factor H [Cardiobacterium hominis]
MMQLQISAAQGPGECQRAAAHVRDRLLQEAQATGIRARVSSENRSAHGIHSAVVELQGENAAAFAARWTGTIQWIWQSRIRPKHRRKNWFVGVFPLTAARDIPRGDVAMQSCKASGKGGQHVNKTRSAVWATDTASGLRVKVQDERSQHANKRLALARLDEQHAALQQAAAADQRADARQQHWQLQRGNPVRVFVGDDFRERSA